MAGNAQTAAAATAPRTAIELRLAMARLEGRVTSATIASYWESLRVRLYVGTRCPSADTFLQLISSRCICRDGRRVRGDLSGRSSFNHLRLSPRTACMRHTLARFTCYLKCYADRTEWLVRVNLPARESNSTLNVHGEVVSSTE